MKNFILLAHFLTLGCLFSTSSFAVGNTSPVKVLLLEARGSGYHAAYISGTIPNEGCILQDRAILYEEDTAGKTEFAMLLSAMLLNKNITLRVDGCSIVDPTQSQYTAPKIVKVLIDGR